MPDPVTLYCYVDFTEPIIIVASKDHKMRRKGTTGKQKHVTLTTPQKPKVIRRLESGKSLNVVHGAYNARKSTIYDIMKQKNQLLFLFFWYPVEVDGPSQVRYVETT